MSQPDVVTMGDPIAVASQECPFCEGEGTIPFHVGGLDLMGKVCHRCGGSGVRAEGIDLVPYPGLAL